MAHNTHMLKSNWLSNLGNKVKDTAKSIAGGISHAKGIWDTAKTIYDVGSKVAPFVAPFLL